MRRLMIIIAAVLFTGAAQAQFRPATLTMTDGSVREGFVETPGPEKNNVDFKAAPSDRRAQSVKSRDVRTIAFTDGAEPREMEYLNRRMREAVIVAVTGWGWLKVVSRGAVSVYMGAKPPVTGSRYTNNEDIMYIYCAGDRYADSPPIATFAAAMSKYFDYPDLSAKIRDKAAGYRIGDIDAIVAEYNAWKEQQ